MNDQEVDLLNDTPVDPALLGAVDEAEGVSASADTNTETGGEKDPQSTAEQAEVKADESDAPANAVETDVAAAEAAANQQQRAQQIPRERFDEVNNRLKDERARADALEAEVRALREAQTVKPVEQDASAPVDVAALEREVMNAYLDGDEARAIELRTQINNELLRQAESRFENKQAVRSQEAEQQEAQRLLNEEANRLVAEHPELDSKTGDPELVGDVIGWRDIFINKGHAPHEALRLAAGKVFPESKGTTDVVDPRKQAAVARNAAAAQQQPSPVEAGLGARTVPFAKVPESQIDWEKLPPAEREKLLQ